MKRVGFVLLVMVLYSCANDDGEYVLIPTTLDQELLATLDIASDGQGTSFFILPNETDLASIPQDPLNPLTPEKVALGKLLVHETATGGAPKVEANKFEYACASCHPVASGFYAGVRQGISEGGMGFGLAGEARVLNTVTPLDSVDILPIKVPTLLNVAYQDIMLWNGALGGTGTNAPFAAASADEIPENLLGLEGLEVQGMAGQDVHRLKIDEEFAETYGYKSMFDAAFPDIAEEERYSRFTGALAIAAFNRTVLANQAPWQDWLKGDFDAMTEEEKRGAVLFFEKGKCVNCHTGPSLKSNEFHALGMGDLTGNGAVILDQENFDENVVKGRGGFTGRAEDNYKFKVPNLYNLADNPFYGHGGTFTSIRQVIEYINRGQKENPLVPDSQLAREFGGLGLTEREIDQLTAFITNALRDPNLQRYEPDSVLSNNCIPNNDAQSKIDLDCE
ncbi:cytochrome-c peroxidase [Leptobacterium flavescens]|uniref:Cytochrome-c peroxidase n=1 Tax=Leptobacterium flavescens TaxID=472055 RepID=A0A6P0UQ99_9FLAO|nr:cytochrome c peroxidase [Leptobacterium flavescens]NER14158.1 cytochrome-c peroxidase [Leptobacterium flavescens]